MDARDTPRAVQILSFDGSKDVRLNADALHEVFSKESLKNVPVAVVSIAGAFRKGKSFLLNFFLHYMRQKGWKNDDWLDDFPYGEENGFRWRGGMKPETKGIFLWNEAFYVETENGKIAVLLMDTQGLFEHGAKGIVNAKILALSTLISSVQIINVFNQIQVDDLEYLRFFVEYTSASLGRENSQLQQLVFLVRDWSNPVDYDYGGEGGKRYLERELNRTDSNSDTGKYIRQLRGIFSELKCFLLPNPMKCRSKDFKGKFEQIDDDFLKHVKSLSSMLLHPRNLLPKRGELRSARALINHVVSCAGQLCSGKLPDVTTMTEATIRSSCWEHYLRALDLYDDKINEAITPGSFATVDNLHELHQEAKSDAVATYNEKCPFAKTSQSKQMELRLVDVIENLSYSRYKGMMELRQTDERMTKLYATIWRKKAARSDKPKTSGEVSEPVQRAAELFKLSLESFIEQNPSYGVKAPSDKSLKDKSLSDELLKCVDSTELKEKYLKTKKHVLESFAGNKDQIKILEKEISRLYEELKVQNKEILEYVKKMEERCVQGSVCEVQTMAKRFSLDMTETGENFEKHAALAIDQIAQNAYEKALENGSSEEAAQQLRDELKEKSAEEIEKNKSFFEKHRDNIFTGLQVAGGVMGICVALPLGGVPLALGGVAALGGIFAYKKIRKQLSRKKLVENEENELLPDS